MNLHYVQEHVKCHHYDSDINPIVEILDLKENKHREFDLVTPVVVFLIEGEVIFSYEEFSNMQFDNRQILLFPPGSRMKISASNEAKVLICRVNDTIRLCSAYTPENLYSERIEPKYSQRINPLQFNEPIDNYLNSFVPNLEAGLRCKHYLDIKIKEIFTLLRAFYTKEQLYYFFNPLLSNNVKFSHLIWSKYRESSTIMELAAHCNYSVSRFKTKFKEIFGIPALQWLNAQRTRNIYYDLKSTEKSLIEISDEYHFSSPSYLSTFCKKNMGLTPTEVRTDMPRKR